MGQAFLEALDLAANARGVLPLGIEFEVARVGIEGPIEVSSLLSDDAEGEVIATSGVDPKDIKAVSATAMREAFVLHDQTGTEIWACANVDARASDEVRALKSSHPDLERDIYTRSGQTYAIGALPRLIWLRKHMPDVLERAQSLTMLSDWVLYRLSGALSSEPSNATARRTARP